MTFTSNCDKPSLLRNINSIYTQKSNLSHILSVRRQITEIFGVCCNKHTAKAPSSLLKKSRLRDLNHVGKRKRKNLRLMTAPVNEECDTKLYCHLFDSMSRDAEMNVPPNMHSHVCITLTFLAQQMVQLNWKHNCHENMMPFNVDWAKHVVGMECWWADKDSCARVIETAALSCVTRPV